MQNGILDQQRDDLPACKSVLASMASNVMDHFRETTVGYGTEDRAGGAERERQRLPAALMEDRIDDVHGGASRRASNAGANS